MDGDPPLEYFSISSSPSNFPFPDLCIPYCEPINYLNPAVSMYPSSRISPVNER